MRGRKPLPQELLNLRGTDRRDRQRPPSTIGTPIPVEKIGDLCQVSGLKGATKRAREIYWALCRRVATQGLLEEAFCQQLLLYAVEYDHWISCCESIKKEGITMLVEDKNGKPIAISNPAVKQRDKATEILLKLGSNFGFSPVDRQRLKLAVEDPKTKGIKAMFAAVLMDDADTVDEQEIINH